MRLYLGAIPTASGASAGAVAAAATGDTATISVLMLQQGLKQRGIDPGPLDGEWGALTEAAYRRWGGAWFSVSADRRQVTIPDALARGLRTLSTAYAARRDVATETTIGPHLDPQVSDELEAATSGDTRLWYGLGAGALAAIGFGFFLSRRKRRRRRR